MPRDCSALRLERRCPAMLCLQSVWKNESTKASKNEATEFRRSEVCPSTSCHVADGELHGPSWVTAVSVLTAAVSTLTIAIPVPTISHRYKDGARAFE